MHFWVYADTNFADGVLDDLEISDNMPGDVRRISDGEQQSAKSGGASRGSSMSIPTRFVRATFPRVERSRSRSSESSSQRETVAAVPVGWIPDDGQNYCYSCATEFGSSGQAVDNALSSVFGGKARRHHCRSCGHIFCHPCSSKRCLIHPDRLVLRGFSIGPMEQVGHTAKVTKALHARNPQRVCDKCFDALEQHQPSLRSQFSNANRFNSVDGPSTSSSPNWLSKTFNSPLAFTLGHEVRKAAHTLSNLLPLPRRLPSSTYRQDSPVDFIDHLNISSPVPSAFETCQSHSSNLRELDGLRIPNRLLEKAKGIAVVTVAKAGLWIGGEIGTGLVVARLPNGDWSAPSAVGLVGFSFGALIGVQLTDHVFLLMTDKAVEMLGTNSGSINLGADVGVAVGPMGRSVEADFGVTAGGDHQHPAIAPIYTYSLSKGLYAGVSLDGKVIATRHDVNENFYGMEVDPYELLSGEIPAPPAAQPLYDALKRCSVYAKSEDRQSAAGPPPLTDSVAFGNDGVAEGAIRTTVTTTTRTMTNTPATGSGALPVSYVSPSTGTSTAEGNQAPVPKTPVEGWPF